MEELGQEQNPPAFTKEGSVEATFSYSNALQIPEFVTYPIASMRWVCEERSPGRDQPTMLVLVTVSRECIGTPRCWSSRGRCGQRLNRQTGCESVSLTTKGNHGKTGARTPSLHSATDERRLITRPPQGDERNEPCHECWCSTSRGGR